MPNPLSPDAVTKRPLPTVVKLAIDFGPLVIFFASFNLVHAGLLLFPKDRAAYIATEATIVASLISVAISLWFTRRISMALLVTTALVVLFGGATIILDDKRFIKIKPTIVYVLYAVVLLTGVITKRPLLRYVFDQGFPPMDPIGWMKLSRNCAVFFLLMAALNEYVRRTYGDVFWFNYDTWGVVVLTGGFMASQYSMISKYIEDDAIKPAEAVTPPPPG